MDKKLDAIAASLNICFDEMDSDDDITGAPPTQEDPKSEFTVKGLYKLSVHYDHMQIGGLYRMFRVNKVWCNKIARGEFVELGKLFKPENRDAVSKAQASSEPGGSATGTGPHTKLEFFDLLYSFASYYLQVYPDKLLGFLDYCIYLTACSRDLTVKGMILLDKEFRSWFMANTHSNWGQDNYEILDIKQTVADNRNPQLRMVKPQNK